MTESELTYAYLHRRYWTENASIHAIAAETGLYAAQVWRAMSKLGVPRRNRSESMKVAHEAGRLYSPAQGGHLAKDASEQSELLTDRMDRLYYSQGDNGGQEKDGA